MVKTGTLENFFEFCGYPFHLLEENSSINIENQNLEILSYNFIKHRIEYKQVISLTRKQNAQYFLLKRKNDDSLLLKGTAAHRIWDPFLNKWSSIVSATTILNNKNEQIPVYCETSLETGPVLDLEILDFQCYFSNGILSHNTSGGNALKFYATQRVDVRRIGGVKNGEVLVANKTKIKCIKNKVAPPFKECEIEIRYGEGIDTVGDLLERATEANIIEKAGAWYSYKENKIGQGAAQAREWLLAHPIEVKEIQKQLTNVS